MTVGVMAGKFLPPHRGHLTSILRAHTMCDKLYVVISERTEDQLLCSSVGCQYISGKLRKKWISQETQNIDGINVLLVNEDGTPPWPENGKEYADLVRAAVKEKIDFMFVGEPAYLTNSSTRFPEAEYILIDPNRSRWNISGTEIRKDPLKNWDFIVGSARSFFAKRILITGTESCGKTTITKKLAKIYNTSWSEEIGRNYSHDYLGGDESAFTDDDFMRISHLQYENDLDALRKANRICFFDTDAVVTSYYANIYLGHEVSSVKRYVDPSRYDLVFFMSPDVKWVDDGLRFLGNQDERWRLHKILKDLYLNAGFDPNKIIDVSGGYPQRLDTILDAIDSLIR